MKYYSKKYKNIQELTKEEKKILSKILERQANRYKYAISKSQNESQKIKRMSNFLKTIFAIVKKLNLPKIKIKTIKTTSISDNSNIQNNNIVIEKENSE